MAHHLAFRGLVRVTSFGRFSDLDWALTPQFLITYRRYAYFVLLVLAVVLTPADFISDLAMTLPLILLF